MGNRTLIGKLLSNRSVNKNTIKSLILRNWCANGTVTVSEVGEKCFMFNFEREDDFDSVQR